MSDIGTGMNAYLLAQATVRALVGDRGFPDKIPQKCKTRPAYTYSLVSDIPSHHLQGKSGISQARMQLDFYSSTRSGANAVGEAVRLLLDGTTGARGNETVRNCHLESTFTDELDPINSSDESEYVVTQDYMIWYVQNTS